MTTKERILAAWRGERADHTPLTTWCFGLQPPAALRWKGSDGEDRRYWYSLRMEHIHTLPQPWTLEDDFKRVLAWQSLGVDDILEVSVPWSVDPSVTWREETVPAGRQGEHPVFVREYSTPSGTLRHAVAATGEEQGEGWVIQPEFVPLIEDYNIPRAVEHAISSPEDVARIKHLYMPPDGTVRDWFGERMAAVRPFAEEHGVPVQAWAGFGMDAVVWFAGTEGAIMMALDEPEAFSKLLEIVAETDAARAELAASHPGVDMVVQRGWYSATDFWSPDLFKRLVLPMVSRLAEVTHRHGKKFAYVITTGVELLGMSLAEAGVDVLYFADPVQDKLSLEDARSLAEAGITVVGGANAVSLLRGDRKQIAEEIRRALDALGETNRFILHPVDALFPDTPWQGVEALIEAWQQYR